MISSRIAVIGFVFLLSLSVYGQVISGSPGGGGGKPTSDEKLTSQEMALKKSIQDKLAGYIGFVNDQWQSCVGLAPRSFSSISVFYSFWVIEKGFNSDSSKQCSESIKLPACLITRKYTFTQDEKTFLTHHFLSELFQTQNDQDLVLLFFDDVFKPNVQKQSELIHEMDGSKG